MPKTVFSYKRVPIEDVKRGVKGIHNSLSKEQFALFNPSLLGLGDISTEGEYVQALAAFLDLQGFTAFCNQVDAHLVIPEFLQRYLNWLFEQLRAEFKESEDAQRVVIWGSLPLFTKFLGDGILLLWDTKLSSGSSGIQNIVLNLNIICENYQKEFLPDMNRRVSKPPNMLRCGIARGQIISVGEGEDYVGSCINVASRLQKLSKLTFAISNRGFDNTGRSNKFFMNLILKKVKLVGIGNEELVYVKKSEFDLLPAAEKRIFKEP